MRATERPVIPKQSTIDATDAANPRIHGYDGVYPAGLGTICDELNQAAAGHPRTHDNPLPIPGNLWKLVGIKNSHNGKLGVDAEYNRPAVPDVASLMLGPVVN